MKDLTKGFVFFAVILSAFIGFANADEKLVNLSTEEAQKKAIEHQIKGTTYDDEGKFNDAVVEYKESLKYSPDDVNTLFNLGAVYLKANKPSEAASTFEKVIKIAPNDFEAYNLLGIAYRGCGKEPEAKKSWERSLALNPNQAKVKEMMKDQVTQRQ